MDSKTKIVVLHTKELILHRSVCISLYFFIHTARSHVWSRSFRQKPFRQKTVYSRYLHIHPHTKQHQSESRSICVDTPGSTPSALQIWMKL